MHFVNTEIINKVVIHFKSSSICVSSGLAVRQAARLRSDQLSNGGQTGGDDRSWQVFLAVRPIDLHRSDRRSLGGQTGASTPVRPRSVEFEGYFYFR